MINDEICKLRNKLNKSIVSGEDYEKIYRISVELDELITKYYIKENRQENYTQKKERKNNGIGIKKKNRTPPGFGFPQFLVLLGNNQIVRIFGFDYIKSDPRAVLALEARIGNCYIAVVANRVFHGIENIGLKINNARSALGAHGTLH